MSGPLRIEDDVLIGGDEQLFLVGGAHWVLDIITGRRQVPEQSFETFRKCVADRAAAAEKLGAIYRHVIFPDKQSVLTDTFPLKDIICLGEMYLKRCGTATESLVIYPLQLLRKYQDRAFLKTDTHLADHGIVHMTVAIVEELMGASQSSHMEALLAKIVIDKSIQGDLGGKLSPPTFSPERCLKEDWGAKFFFNYLEGGNNGLIDIHVSPNAIYNKRLLIFGDSCARAAARVFSYFFWETVVLRSPFFHSEVVAQMRPDFVLSENVERYMSFIKSDDARPSFFMYPYLTEKPINYHPSRDFAEVFSAILSFPRSPYQVYAEKFGRPT